MQFFFFGNYGIIPHKWGRIIPEIRRICEMKITFMGAGSTIFAKNVLGDTMLCDALCESEICLYDIDGERLKESYLMLDNINRNSNQGRAVLKTYLGVENRGTRG